VVKRTRHFSRRRIASADFFGCEKAATGHEQSHTYVFAFAAGAELPQTPTYLGHGECSALKA